MVVIAPVELVIHDSVIVSGHYQASSHPALCSHDDGQFSFHSNMQSYDYYVDKIFFGHANTGTTLSKIQMKITQGIHSPCGSRLLVPPSINRRPYCDKTVMNSAQDWIPPPRHSLATATVGSDRVCVIFQKIVCRGETRESSVLSTQLQLTSKERVDLCKRTAFEGT